MNFGGFATPERNIVFDINDLDETLPAPFEWDVKRLATSMVIAAEHLNQSNSDVRHVVRHTVREYRRKMLDYSGMRVLDIWYDRIDLRKYSDKTGDPEVVADARKRLAGRIELEKRKGSIDHLYPKLVSERGGLARIKDDPPLIYHPDSERTPGFESDCAAAIALYRRSLPGHVRTLFNRFHASDLAVKVVGVGSVGTMCAVYLFLTADGDPLFLQIKEARASVLEPYAGKSNYSNHGQRVVAGQHLMQTASDIFTGWTQVESGRHFYIRQLRDMKISANLDDWDEGMLGEYGRMCAHALAHAHARSGDPAAIAGYMGSSSKFEDAVSEFAIEYCAQNQSDYRELLAAIKSGSIKAVIE